MTVTTAASETKPAFVWKMHNGVEHLFTDNYTFRIKIGTSLHSDWTEWAQLDIFTTNGWTTLKSHQYVSHSYGDLIDKDGVAHTIRSNKEGRLPRHGEPGYDAAREKCKSDAFQKMYEYAEFLVNNKLCVAAETTGKK